MIAPIGSLLVRIDAPEKAQICDDRHRQPCLLAKKALEGFIAGRLVTCKQVDYDARPSSGGAVLCGRRRSADVDGGCRLGLVIRPVQ